MKDWKKKRLKQAMLSLLGSTVIALSISSLGSLPATLAVGGGVFAVCMAGFEHGNNKMRISDLLAKQVKDVYDIYEKNGEDKENVYNNYQKDRKELVKRMNSGTADAVRELTILHDKEVDELNADLKLSASNKVDLGDQLSRARRELKASEKELEEYSEKAKVINDDLLDNLEAARGKIYEIPLVCAHCGAEEGVEFDLGKGEYTCTQCHNINSIHTNVFTARMSDTIVNGDEVMAQQR